jgi:HEAT repeat protein
MRCTRRLAAVALALTLNVATAYADRFPPDPVEELKKDLKATGLLRDPEGRRQLLQKRAEALHTISDLRRALLLDAWRDEDPDIKLAEADASVRRAIAKRFDQAVRAALRTGMPTSRQAVADMIADVGVTAKGFGTKSGLMREFVPDLVELLKQPELGVRQAAARALGQINPDPAVAVPALAGLLDSPSVADRTAAADGLTNLVRNAVTNGTRATSSTTAGVQVSFPEVVAAAKETVPVVARHLNDPSEQVRRHCADAMIESAAGLGRLVADPYTRDDIGTTLEDARKAVDEERGTLSPLMNALKDAAPALARGVSDPDPETRVRVRRTLEEMSYARRRFRNRVESVQIPAAESSPKEKEKATSQRAEDVLLDGLRVAFPALAAGLSDRHVPAQLAALDALEWLGPDAAGVAPAVVQAMADSDLFVRWAAARVMGGIGPVDLPAALPALVRLLDDKDLNLRRAAATALQGYGPAARAAVPALTRTLGATDAGMRKAAILALQGIGTEAAPAIPALGGLMSDPDARVRQAAAEALARFGPTARAAVPQLRQALGDESIEVRKAASDALLNILQPPQ